MCQPEIEYILFISMMNGVLCTFSICNTSAVWGLMPSFMLTTRIAKSAREPPRFLRFVNAACPGVPMNRKPGISCLIF